MKILYLEKLCSPLHLEKSTNHHFKTYHVRDSHPMLPNLATSDKIFICLFYFLITKEGGDSNSSVNYVNRDLKAKKTLHYTGCCLIGMLLSCWFSKENNSRTLAINTNLLTKFYLIIAVFLLEIVTNRYERKKIMYIT